MNRDEVYLRHILDAIGKIVDLGNVWNVVQLNLPALKKVVVENISWP